MEEIEFDEVQGRRMEEMVLKSLDKLELATMMITAPPYRNRSPFFS